MDIKNKVVVITGGAQGLGFSMAESFAAKGARLALIDMNEAALKAASAKLTGFDSEVRGYCTNIANENAVEELFTTIVKDFGSLDCLINNAGITRDGLFLKAKEGKVTQRMSLQDWQTVIDVNLTGVFLCGREAASKMIELDSRGVIINISSLSKAGNMGQANYSAAKAGVASLTVVWAKELARYGIRSAGIAPGFIATDMVKSMKPEVLDKIAATIPLKRLGKPCEIGMTAIYIAENDYFTGRTIEMDGGVRV